MSYDICLRTVARLADHTHFDIPRAEVRVRKGTYPYYGDLFERFCVDDYGLNEPAVIFMAAAGRVLNADGGFRAALERGRCGSNSFAHVVVAHDSADADYLFACLTTLPNAVDYIGGANQLQTLDELAVLRVALPWPCRATRDAYVAALAHADADVAAARQALKAPPQATASSGPAGSAPDVPDLPAPDALRSASSAVDAALQKRAILIRDFMEFGVLGDCDCTPTEPVTGTFGTSYSDARAERACNELRARAEREAAERGGLALGDRMRAALGPLAHIATHCTGGLAPADVAWELAPLAVVRAAVTPAAWAAVMQALDGGMAKTVVALDAALAELAAADPCFSLMPNLSYASTLLASEQLAGWLRALDAVAPARIGPDVVRAAFDLECGAPALPAEVVRLVAALAAQFVHPGQGVYLPRAGADALADVCAAVLPACPVQAQCADTAALLSLLAVRGVAAAHGGRRAAIDACAPGASALVDDRFAGGRAGLVLLDVPWQPGAWRDDPPRRDDPRWVLGAPTRMRSAWAWIQQALAHLDDDGRAIALVPTRELQTGASVDEANLHALVEQGRVQAVVALPPRIWGDDRPPASLAVLGAPGSAPACLMVDACGLDVFDDEAVFGPNPQRALAEGAAARIADVLRAWFAGDAASASVEGLSRVASREELAESGGLLAPWLYVGHAR